MIKFSIPIRTVSPNRVRGLTRGAALGHAARKKKERNTAKMCFQASGGSLDSGPTTITLTRVSPGTLDGDNLASSCKAARDGIADGLGINDGDPRITWVYAQKKCARRSKKNPVGGECVLVEIS